MTIQIIDIGIKEIMKKMVPSKMSKMRLTMRPPPERGVTLTRITGMSPTSSNSPNWEERAASDGTK